MVGKFKDGKNFIAYSVVHDDGNEWLIYEVVYVIKKIKKIGKVVQQTSVWRDRQNRYDKEDDSATFPTATVFEYFLAFHDGVVTDKIQTEGGQDFWAYLILKVINEYPDKYKISAIDHLDRGAIVTYKYNMDIGEWIKRMDPWNEKMGKYYGLIIHK